VTELMLTLTVCSLGLLPRLVMLKATTLGAVFLTEGGILWLDGCLATLTDWFYTRDGVFTARYELSVYNEQTDCNRTVAAARKMAATSTSKRAHC
jgi:hypothetical protein